MWTANWGLVINAIAAAGAFSAAIVALSIATWDRRERSQERHDAARAQAKLILVHVTADNMGFAGFGVEVRNYGSTAVLDVEVDSAGYASAPGSKWRLRERSPQSFAVLDSNREPQSFFIEFVDDAGQSVITGKRDGLGMWLSDNADPKQVTATVRFTDSQGNHWERSTNSIVLLKSEQRRGVVLDGPRWTRLRR